MSLTETIRADLTTSMKARTAERTSVLRMVQSALKNEQIEKGRELTDEEALSVIRRGIKQRQDSVEQYRNGGRNELAAKEESEIEILQAYMPKQMSDEEAEAAVKEAIAAVGAASRKDSGKVMKEVMSHHKGVIDGKKVQELVGRLLP